MKRLYNQEEKDSEIDTVSPAIKKGKCLHSNIIRVVFSGEELDGYWCHDCGTKLSNFITCVTIKRKGIY